MANLPTDIANQALDAAGIEFTLGDLEEGTRPAQVILRAYWQCLRQLLRGAHWNFARKSAPLVLLADGTGNTPNVGKMVPVSQFYYEYAYPIDCMKVRFIPWFFQNQAPGVPANNIQLPTGTPQNTGGSPPFAGQRIRPARWLEATDNNYPPTPGMITWETQGVSPQGRTVILTNVQNASVVYTALMLYPSTWDVLFRAALVSYLASEIALPLHKDKKFALALRPQLIQSVKAKLEQARLTDGNEGWFSSDIPVDWMSSRRTGGRGGWGGGWWGDVGGGGPGQLWGGWDSCGFSDGSAY